MCFFLTTTLVFTYNGTTGPTYGRTRTYTTYILRLYHISFTKFGSVDIIDSIYVQNLNLRHEVKPPRYYTYNTYSKFVAALTIYIVLPSHTILCVTEEWTPIDCTSVARALTEYCFSLGTSRDLITSRVQYASYTNTSHV